MIVTNQTQALAHEILAYWLRFNRHDQNQWIGDSWNFDMDSIQAESLPTGAEINVCQTTLCAAGTAVFLSNTPKDFVDFVRDADFDRWLNAGAKALGLSHAEARKVFLSDDKSAKRFMRAIAEGSQKKFDKALNKRRMIPGAV